MKCNATTCKQSPRIFPTSCASRTFFLPSLCLCQRLPSLRRLPTFQPSTNGTWFRLSGMHTESRPYPLSNGAEILIGTVRGGERARVWLALMWPSREGQSCVLFSVFCALEWVVSAVCYVLPAHLKMPMPGIRVLPIRPRPTLVLDMGGGHLINGSARSLWSAIVRPRARAVDFFCLLSLEVAHC